MLLTARARAQSTQVLGFSDVDYVQTDRDVPGGFVLGQMVGHVVSSLSDRLFFSTELSATGRPTGYSFEVERVILRYDFSDLLKISAGRYHTPISYWNTAFHHGLWLQTSVSRPQMIRFGNQFMPVHFIGLMAEGALPGTPLGLGYVAGIGNGRQDDLSRGGDAGDVNDHRAWVLGLTSRPMSIYGLEVGASLYRDRVPSAVDPVGETIYSAHVVWLKETPEIIAEYARVLHDESATGEGAVANDAYYVQVGYRLPGALRAFKPYARAERLDAAGDDPVFAPLDLGYNAIIAGVRYDFAPLAALKGEYRNERFEGAGRSNSFYVQLAFTFPSLFSEEHTHP